MQSHNMGTALGAALLCAIISSAAPAALAQERAPAGAQASDAIHEDKARVQATLIFDAEQIAPADTLRAGVLLELDEGWHVYWYNSGEAGLSTQIKFKVTPEGLKPGPMSWPAPEVFIEGDGQITTYGYHHEVLHDVAIELPADLPHGTLKVEAKVDFLTCAHICVPGRMQLERTIEIGPKTLVSAQAQRFEAQAVTIPTPAAEANASVKLDLKADQLKPLGQPEATITVTLPPCPTSNDCPTPKLDAKADQLAFIPLAGERSSWKVKDVNLERRVATITLQGTLPSKLDLKADHIGGVLRLTQAGQPKHLLIDEVFSLQATPVLATPSSTPTLTQGAASSQDAPTPDDGQRTPGFLMMLLMAFLGGILLNAMPCVFPVLTLKVAALAELAHKDPRVTRAHGLAYAGGILSTMLVMAGILIGLKMASAQVGWGFQFQSPWFLVGLSAALTLFALNLFGVFEVNLPFGGKLGALQLGEDGLARSWAEGLLCVLLSTPCSAPFMGTAMGFALVSPAPTTIALFLALGAGLASPFVTLTMMPGWRRFLPKPGDWLLRLKQFLGFTLLGTSWWLLWLLGSSYGVDGITRAGVFLLVLGLSAWLYGIVQFMMPRAKRLGTLMALAMTITTGALALRWSVPDEQPARVDAQGWAPFDEETIKASLAQGQPVFVDFTADWCITCKVNERTVLERPPVLAAFAQYKVVKLKADWTRQDDRIRAILQRHGKAGVPMYLLYSPAAPDKPQVLPEVLTTSIITEALARTR